MKIPSCCWVVTMAALLSLCPALFARKAALAANRPPNILFAIADDWSWPHAGAYGDPVVRTPTFDRLAREGILFSHVYVSSPSCTPSRGATLTGQWHWRLKAGANLWSIFPDEFVTYPELLKKAGYDVGYCGKGWGPGRPATPGREMTGKHYRDFQQFAAQWNKDQPFCFWLGSFDPHRPYKAGTGAKSGLALDKIKLLECFPDAPEVRADVADYYFEVERFDRAVGAAVKTLESLGQLDNTLVVMTSDNGMPFPRCKSNLYDGGTRMPLAIRWSDRVKAGRTVSDFVSFTDFAPTFLDVAQVTIPATMTGRSILPLLQGSRSGRIDPSRDFTLVGKERHCPAQDRPNMGGYPCRGIRTDDFFFIRNYAPDRWPAGTPDYRNATFPGSWYGDCDNGPTKTYMVAKRDQDAVHRRLFALAFAKRPAVELYDLKKDPQQLHNVAGDPDYRSVQSTLDAKLTARLKATGDPRAVGRGDQFDKYEYLGGAPTYPGWKKPKTGGSVRK